MPNNLEEKYAATESREVKQLYCQSFVMMQRLGINRVFLWFVQLIIKICLNAIGPPRATGRANSIGLLCCKEIEGEKDVKQISENQPQPGFFF